MYVQLGGLQFFSSGRGGAVLMFVFLFCIFICEHLWVVQSEVIFFGSTALGSSSAKGAEIGSSTSGMPCCEFGRVISNHSLAHSIGTFVLLGLERGTFS